MRTTVNAGKSRARRSKAGVIAQHGADDERQNTTTASRQLSPVTHRSERSMTTGSADEGEGDGGRSRRRVPNHGLPMHV
jgi:hypothetical protein